jgi:uncharacterized membrane protein
MDRMLVVVFENERNAYEGKTALLDLNKEGSIGIYGYAILAKAADGKTTVKTGDDAGPLGALTGTALGSMVGLLGGPVGVAVGAASGMAGGAAADLHNARISDDFVDDVSKMLKPNTVAIVAEIEEDWITPVDTRMEKIGGTIFRRSLSDVEDTVNDEDVAAMKADIAQMKAEHAQAGADRKQKIQQKIDQLSAKLQAHLQKAKEQRQAAERDAQLKADVLKAKAKAAKAGA